jgi:THAP4-like, heme-binding beta-barrel domain
MELYLGKLAGPTRLEMGTDAIVRSPSGAEVTGGHRLFGIVEGALLYAHEMAGSESDLQPHLSARLLRIGG